MKPVLSIHINRELEVAHTLVLLHKDLSPNTSTLGPITCAWEGEAERAKEKGIWLSGSDPEFQDSLVQVHIYKALLSGIPRDIIKTWGCSHVISSLSLLWHLRVPHSTATALMTCP